MPTKAKAPDLVWRAGPPPHIGWWNAGTGKHPRIWRWWNGKAWSVMVMDSATAQVAGKDAKYRTAIFLKEIFWNDSYPDNARVPRIDPRSKS